MKVTWYELALTYILGYVLATLFRPDWAEVVLVAVGILLWARFFVRQYEKDQESAP